MYLTGRKFVSLHSTWRPQNKVPEVVLYITNHVNMVYQLLSAYYILCQSHRSRYKIVQDFLKIKYSFAKPTCNVRYEMLEHCATRTWRDPSPRSNPHSLPKFPASAFILHLPHMEQKYAYNIESDSQETPDTMKDKTGANESPEEKEETRRKLTTYSAIIKDAFSEKDVQAMCDYFANTTRTERETMLQQAPLLAHKEKEWQRERGKWQAKDTRFASLLDNKLEREGSTVDRRTLMAEAIWEMEIGNLGKTAPSSMSDFAAKHGKFDRYLFETKHGGKAVTLLADFDAVEERAQRVFMNRLAFEYGMTARAHFRKEDAEALIEKMTKDTKTPEKRLAFFNKIVEDFAPAEAEFNSARDKVKEENPAAHDLFMRMYYQNTKNQTFEQREVVLKKAVDEVEQSMKTYTELQKTNEGTTQKDPSKTKKKEEKKFEKIEDIYAAIAELNGENKKETAGKKPSEMTEAERSAAFDSLQEQIITNDRQIQELLLQRKILEAQRRALLHHGDTGIEAGEEKEREISRITHKRDQEIIKDSAHELHGEQTGEKEEFGELEIRDDLLSVSLREGVQQWKDKDDKARAARILTDIGDQHLEEKGLHLGVVVDQKGEKVDEQRMKERIETIDKQVDTLSANKMGKSAKEAGLSKDDVENETNKAGRKNRQAQMQTALDAVKKAA